MRVEQRQDGTLARVLTAVELDLYSKVLSLQSNSSNQELIIELAAAVSRINQLEAAAVSGNSQNEVMRYFSWTSMLKGVGTSISDISLNHTVWQVLGPGRMAYTTPLNLPSGVWTLITHTKGSVKINVASGGVSPREIQAYGSGWHTNELTFMTLKGDVVVTVDALGPASLDYIALRLGASATDIDGTAATGNATFANIIATTLLQTSTYQLPYVLTEAETLLFLGGVLQTYGVTGDYTIVSKTLSFYEPAQPNQNINLLFPVGTYCLSRTTIETVGNTTSEPLPVGCPPDGELIFVNGVLLDEGALDDYTVAGGIITFNDTIGIGQVIEILHVDDVAVTMGRTVYLSDGALSTYQLPTGPTGGTELVFVNGILMTAGLEYDYSISGNTVVLSETPTIDSFVTLVTLTRV
jgi:hypothetical protein